MAGAVAAFCGTIGSHGLPIRTAGYKLYILETMTCSLHCRNYSTLFWWAATFSWPLLSLWPAWDMSLGRGLLVACFSSIKNHNVSGPHLFPSFTNAKKIPLPPLGRSHSEQKNHFAIGRNSERCSYHTDWSRFVLHISDPSALNLSDSRIPQFWAKSKKLRKRANLTEKSRCLSKEPEQSQ